MARTPKTRSKKRTCRSTSKSKTKTKSKVVTKKKSNSVLDKSEFGSGFLYLRIQQRQNGTKFFLSSRNLRLKSKNSEKHMADHSMHEQQLRILYCLRYLPSQLSLSRISEKLNKPVTPIEANLVKFLDEYNHNIKEFPNKFKYDETPEKFIPDIQGDVFEEEYNILLKSFIKKHGPLVQSFKYPLDFEIEEEQTQNESMAIQVNEDNSNANQDGIFYIFCTSNFFV